MTTSNNKIPFGLKDGVLVGISEVQSGLACGCLCPSCNRKLQANKGQKIAPYFSHDPTNETNVCESAFETSIHLMAKQILSEEGVAIFPKLSVKVKLDDENGHSHEDAWVVTEELLMNFNQVEMEKRLDNIRPDIIGYLNSVPYLIEIAVTHFSNAEKVKKIRAKNICAIEIDLSKIDYTTTKDELTKLIVDKVDNKKWLSNPTAVQIKAELKARLEEKIKRINENILNARRETKASFDVERTLANKKYSTLTHSYKTIRSKDYDPRWFWCEACHYLFDIPLKNAPYTIDTIKCPDCAHDVSSN